MDKPAIKKFAIWARNKLIADTKYRAGLVGVTETAVAEPLPQSNETVQFFDVGLPQPYRIEGEAVTQRQRFVAELNKETAKQGSYTAAYQTVVDKVAYTWFNRLIAVRYMEVNDLLPSRTRVLSSTDGRAEPQIVTSPFDAVLDYSPAELQQIVNLKNDNKLDEAFRLLFLKQCAALGDCLPRLFEQVDDYMPLLLALSFTDKDGVVCHLVNDIPESDWQDAVQIVGWLYQYYNTEPKEQVFANLKKNIKISKENIPAATQLFTPDWIVRYMVENSLGRLWSEGHPDFDKSEWKYYLDEAPQEPQVAQQLAELRKGYAALTPEDIKCIDPCMGSGHILAYLFDVLMQIYRSAGYTDRDAAASIVEHNLYGLDIDDRAAQMAYFVVMMKGCHYDSRFLRRHLNPHVYAIQESSGMNARLSDYVKKYYPDSKSDLFACFMERADTFVKENRFTSLITMESWMFLSSFEKLRDKVNLNKTIVNMVHMPYLGKGGTSLGINFGTAAVVMKKGHIRNYAAQYEYTVYYECDEEGVPFVFPTKNERWKTATQENFSKIPGSPVAYWVSENFIGTFVRGISIDSISKYTGSQNITANNEKYLRYIWEVVNTEVGTNTHWAVYIKGGTYRKWYGNIELVVDWSDSAREFYKNNPTSNLLGKPYRFREGITYTELTSGTNSFRYLPAIAIFDKKGPCIVDVQHRSYCLAFFNTKVAVEYFKLLNPTITLQVKDVKNIPIIFDDAYMQDVESIANSNVELCRKDWDSFETSWNFAEHPLVKWSRQLWDATSIGATMAYYYHSEPPEVSCPVELCYLLWQGECNDRFVKLKANEEELNRIFIDIYGLQDELTPEVEDKDVTVRRADRARDIRSLISYAVGCIFGRYSLDKSGLTYAGGDWNPDQYHTFFPDADNVIPITDEEYFTDDLTGLFVAWVKKVFGADSLEDNLAFIAKALGTKGTSPRAVIRNYFLNGFYADHVKIYQKRPIYWLYDSGKQNGFKALIYMHRYNADTSGTVRADYLYKMEQVYESEIARMDDAIAHGASREVAQATKRKEKLVKQLKECKDYDDRLGHIALARIPIDLDDGVKLNYEKVQTGADGKKQAILAKI